MSKKHTGSRSSNIQFHEADAINIIVTAKNPEQREFLKELSKSTITIVRGPAGTGKTFLAVTYAMQQLLRGKCERIVLTRPVVEAAGERLGFLPGDMLDKIDPYMMPIYEALTEIIQPEALSKMLPKNGRDTPIKVIPLAYMRGATFKKSFIICDEMQNSTPDQFRMLLTRLGENSKMVICGDTRQSDIFGENGLEDAYNLLQGIDGISFVTMSDSSIVRHPLIQAIEQRYEERMAQKRKKNTV